jgi:hypothetical protein
MKQETTSEAFYRISKELNYSEFDFLSFKIGIEWQQEQDKKMYSEEDMRKAYCRGYGAIVRSSLNDCFYEWFEQFKKK